MVQKKSSEPKDTDATEQQEIEHLPWPPAAQHHALPPKATGGLNDMNGHDIVNMKEPTPEANEIPAKSTPEEGAPAAAPAAAFIQMKVGNYTEELIDKKDK